MKTQYETKIKKIKLKIDEDLQFERETNEKSIKLMNEKLSLQDERHENELNKKQNRILELE